MRDHGWQFLFYLLLALFYYLAVPLMRYLRRRAQFRQLREPPVQVEAATAEALEVQRQADAESALAARSQVTASVDALLERARRLERKARNESAHSFIAEPLETDIVPTLRRLSQQSAVAALDNEQQASVRLIGDQVRMLAVLLEQRHHAQSAAVLAATDAVAADCYRPLNAFAYAEGLQQRSRSAVTVLGSPTREDGVLDRFAICLLRLPTHSAGDLRRWPLLGHEVAGDLLRSCAGLAQGLEQELADAQTLPEAHHWLVESWLPDFFPDAVATFLFGPAYGWARLHQPGVRSAEAYRARLVSDGIGYRMTMPVHLRMVFVRRLLEQLACEDWSGPEGAADRRPPDGMYLAETDQGVFGLEADPLIAQVRSLADDLHGRQLKVLSGYRLVDVPGLDFGPHEEASVGRIAEALLEGQSTPRNHPRRIVSGALLAVSRGAPLRDVSRRAQAAITGDALSSPQPTPGAEQAASVQSAGIDPREALVLATLLSRPQSAKARRARGPSGLR